MDVYPDIGTRPMQDLDLWILEEDRPAVVNTLISAGYGNEPGYPLTFRRNGTILDLHLDPLGADRIRSRRRIVTVGTRTLFDATVAGTFEGRSVRRFSLVDQVIFLGLHALKHNLSRLVWLADLEGLLAQFDDSSWERLRDRAGDLGQMKTIARLSLLRERLLKRDPPPAVIAADIPTVGSFERTVLARRTFTAPLPEWAAFLFYVPEKGLGRRFRNFFESLFPRPEILRQSIIRHRRLRTWQLYPVRAAQIIGWILAAARSGLRALFRR